tara:strand:- start:1884 stop:3035 length:1152 start_codon:yes stop_codon:yes gene_type:complete
MIIYWILFLIPLTISVLPDKLNIKLNNQLILLYGIICTLFIGFRYQIGGDWGIYDNWARLINTIDFIEVFNMFSPGYNMMVWISVNLGFGVLLSNTICALLFIIGLTIFVKSLPNPWLGYVIAFPYLITVVGMGYSRQAVVIGFSLWCFDIWRKNNKFSTLKILILASIAITFHKTGLLIFFLVLINSHGNYFRFKNLLFFIPLALGFFYYLISVNLGATLSYYFAQSNIIKTGQAVAYGAQARAFLNIPATILFFYFYKDFRVFGDRRLWTIIAIVSVIFFIIAPFYTTIIDRLALFLISFQMLVYSRLTKIIKNNFYRFALIYSVCGFYILIFTVWLFYSLSSYMWIPYKINLFQSNSLYETLGDQRDYNDDPKFKRFKIE